MKSSLVVIAALTLLPAMAKAATPASRCHLNAKDRAWLDRSVKGWSATRHLLLKAPEPERLDAIIFDRDCQLTSRTAMKTGRAEWRGAAITGPSIPVGAQQIPVGVISATIGDDAGTRFVMSTPSVWANGVPPGPLGLETLMSAVMMHEATHVFQMGTYGRQIDRLQKENRLSDEQFNDDAIQAHFGEDRKFTASIERETELLFSAASAPEAAATRKLAREARTLMCDRRRRYFVGDQAYQARAEDLWLTMEGSAQWAGYRWMQLPVAKNGAGINAATAMTAFGRRGNSWTQLEGLAMALVVERIGPVDWRARVFGDGRATMSKLLDDALAPDGPACSAS